LLGSRLDAMAAESGKIFICLITGEMESCFLAYIYE
jgi:hypothetical protein